MKRVGDQVTEDERELLDQLVDDGWPMAVLAPGGGYVQTVALSLVRKGLAEVYGEPDNEAVSREEAEAIIRSAQSWAPGEGQPVWMICASDAGHRLLRDSAR